MTRYIVDIDVDPQRRNDERAEPALEWVTSVFTAGGLRTEVADLAQRLLAGAVRPSPLTVRAWRLLEPDLAMQRAELEHLLDPYSFGVTTRGETIDAIIELLG